MEIIITSLSTLISVTILLYVFFRVNLEKVYLKDLEVSINLSNKESSSLKSTQDPFNDFPSDVQI